ncbi:class I SAM-dependent methyltransferase [Saccharothrix saharensis]|uniref:class I SAM-dependent methyltransferase n=1 Tax=Saccharothrix saharensis TaxID=571190 RepID=UPI0036A7F8B9
MNDPGAELFYRVAADYHRSVPFFATFGARLVRWVAPEAGARVLDLGAGRGAVTAALVGAGCPVVAGDVSAAMLDGLHDALPEADRAAFRDRVLRGLRDDHPTGGTTVVAGAEFHRVVKRPLSFVRGGPGPWPDARAGPPFLASAP